MYCVTCGNALQLGYTHGIICRSCWYALEQQMLIVQRTHKEQRIIVSFCRLCGQPFHPQGLEIVHRVCPPPKEAS